MDKHFLQLSNISMKKYDNYSNYLFSVEKKMKNVANQNVRIKEKTPVVKAKKKELTNSRRIQSISIYT